MATATENQGKEKRTRQRSPIDIMDFVDKYQRAKTMDEAAILTGLKKTHIASKVSYLRSKYALPLKHFERVTTEKKSQTRDNLLKMLARINGVSEDQIRRESDELLEAQTRKNTEASK